MSIAMQKVMNDYASALQQIEELEKALTSEKTNATNVVRGLVSGDLPKERVVITDTGFDIMPEMPELDPPKEPSKNGAKAKVKA